MKVPAELSDLRADIDIVEQGDALFYRVATAAGLGAIAVGAFAAQHMGLTNELGTPFEQITESLCHPELGYIGAWVGLSFARFRSRGRQMVAAAAGGTLANFSAEFGQALMLQMPGEGYFWSSQQTFETTKDLAFAGLGAALAYVQQKPSLRSSSD